MRALITRPRENAGPIARALAQRDIDVLLEPLLEIGPTEHEPIDLDGVQAVLVTSAFGVRELANAIAARDIPIFAVGDATAEVAQEAGFATVESARGDAEALSALVMQHLDPKAGALLHAAGRTTAGEFPDQLADAGFEIRRVELYAARPAAALSIEAASGLERGRLDMALFFSPRTAATFVRLVEAAGLADRCAAVTAFCFSPAVAEAVAGIRWRGVETAPRPDHDAMVGLVEDWVARQQAPEADPVASEPAPAPAHPATAAERAPAYVPPPPPARAGVGWVPLIVLLLLLSGAFAAGIYALWRDQDSLAARLAEQRRPLGEDPTFTALRQRVEGAPERIAGELAAVERRLTARIAEAEQRLSAVTQEIEGLGQQVAAGESQEGEAAESDATLRKNIEALGARVSGLEEALRQANDTLSGRLAAADEARKQESEAIGGRLDRQAEQNAELRRSLEERIAGVAEAAKKAASDNLAGVLLAVGQIRSALGAGEPFVAPLDTLRQVGTTDAGLQQRLQGWSDLAGDGIPTVEALTTQFQAIASKIESPVQVETGRGWLDQAIGRAASIVRVRRVGEDVAGDSPDAILARSEAALERGELEAAIGSVEALPAEPKALFAEWLRVAHARVQAQQALAAIERSAVERAGGG